MRHLSDEICELPKTGGVKAYIKHLDMFGVIGIISPNDAQEVIVFCKHNIPNVRYRATNTLVWMPTVGERLDRQFSGYKQREERKPLPGILRALPAIPPWQQGGSSDVKEY